MSDENKFGCLMVCVTLFFAVTCFVAGLLSGISLHKFTAVEDGVAEYYLDSDHNKQWRWKATPEAKQ